MQPVRMVSMATHVSVQLDLLETIAKTVSFTIDIMSCNTDTKFEGCSMGNVFYDIWNTEMNITSNQHICRGLKYIITISESLSEMQNGSLI